MEKEKKILNQVEQIQQAQQEENPESPLARFSSLICFLFHHQACLSGCDLTIRLLIGSLLINWKLILLLDPL